MKDIHLPKKSLGQHFLTNASVADRIVEHAGLTANDIVLEIGPGRGILTGRLLERGCTVTAVELDSELVRDLAARFGEQPGFRLVEADILTVDFDRLFHGASCRIKVVSNLPYYISTPIIDLLCRKRALVSEAVLMVQREVAKRLLAQPGSKAYGLTTVNLALCAEGRRLFDVNPGSFSPPPEVVSSVISLGFHEDLRYPLENEGVFYEVTGAAFRHRRKMVRNTLVPYLVTRGIGKADALDILSSAGIEPTARPEEVDVGSFVLFSNAVAGML